MFRQSLPKSCCASKWYPLENRSQCKGRTRISIQLRGKESLTSECHIYCPTSFDFVCISMSREVYLQLARIHERNKKLSLATKAYELCSRKFPQSKKVWIAFLTFLYQNSERQVCVSSSLISHLRVILANPRAEVSQRKKRNLSKVTVQHSFKLPFALLFY